jgi:dipeptidase E
MAASGLDKILKKLLKYDKIMYGGSSAGSCVAAPSLHGVEYGDRPNPDIVPKGYPSKKIIWEGLNLVPFAIVPHQGSDWYGDKAAESIAYFKKHKIPYKPLSDGQVVVVRGDKTEFLK